MREGVVSLLKGGLGNQLFIWAAGYSLSRKLGVPHFLDISGILRHSQPGHERAFQLDYFGIDTPIVEWEPREKGKRRSWNWANIGRDEGIFKEKGPGFDPRFEQISDSIALDGYFQSIEYFEAYKSEVRSYLQNEQMVTADATAIKSRLPESWIGVHVRRGDYLNAADFHSIPGESYYAAAVHTAQRISGVRAVVVFTDDAKAAKTCVPDAELYLSTDQISHPGDVINLLRFASAFVGANSSLSWWSAFSSNSPARPCIFPRPWYAEGHNGAHDHLLRNWLTVGI